MLIKGIKDGKAIPFNPEEIPEEMVSYALKEMNSEDKIYMLKKGSVVVESMNTNKDAKGNWIAQVTGSAMVGYTCGKTRRVFEFKKKSFFVVCESTKDDLGQPDIKITNKKIEDIDLNPSKNVGAMPEVSEKVLSANKKKDK